MANIGDIVKKSWFFIPTKTALKEGTRLKDEDFPTEGTFRNLLASMIGKDEPDDRAKEDTGAYSKDTTGHVVLSSDAQAKAKTSKKADRSLVAQPSQLPEVIDGTTVSLSSGSDTYTGSMVDVEDDVAVTERSSYKLSIPTSFQSFLNTVFSKIETLITDLGVLDADYQVTKGQVATNTAAIDGLSGGTLSQIIPVGMMSPYGGTAAPTGWVLLQGDVELDKTTYSALYAIVGDVHGAPVDNNNFVVWKATYDGAATAAAGSGTRFTTAGADSFYLNKNQMSEHEHGSGSLVTDTSGSHSHVDGGTSQFGGTSPALSNQVRNTGIDYNGFRFNTSTSGDHSHPIEGSTGGVDGLGTQQPIDNRQSTMYVNYMMFHGVI